MLKEINVVYIILLTVSLSSSALVQKFVDSVHVKFPPTS